MTTNVLRHNQTQVIQCFNNNNNNKNHEIIAEILFRSNSRVNITKIKDIKRKSANRYPSSNYLSCHHQGSKSFSLKLMIHTYREKKMMKISG